MSATAWVFPGQGSQSPGMGRQLLEQFPRAREILAIAEHISRLPLDRLRQRGPASELQRPEVSEPLVTAISIAYAEVMREHGLRPGVIAGYSCGEVAAYCAAGVLNIENALKVAVLRGQTFADFTHPQARMVTIAGVRSESCAEVVEELQQHGRDVHIAAVNAPMHATLVGTDQCVIEAESILLRLGAEASQVAVAGKWHSPHLAGAVDPLRSQLEAIPFHIPHTSILSCTTGNLVQEPMELRHNLAIGVRETVQWRRVVHRMLASQVPIVVECGSGRVLFGMMRHNAHETQCQAICVEDRNGGIRPLLRLTMECTSS